MRTCGMLTVFFIGLATAASQAEAATSNALPATAMDSCGPSFPEIYDFQVGDVFQGEQTSMNAGNGESKSQIEEKYEIVSRETIQGGYRYGIEGRVRSTYTSSSPYGPSSTQTGYGKVSEIWEFSDSTDRKALNGCKDQVVRFPHVGANYAGSGSPFSGIPITGNFTRVRIAIGDTASFPLTEDATRLKILGAPAGGLHAGNLYKDSALKVASQDQVWAVYAAGLGLVRLTAFVFESRIDFRLQGYSRGGVTVGTVYPDAVFIGPDAIRLTAPRNSGDPRVLRVLNAGPLFLGSGSALRDLSGRRTFAFPPEERSPVSP